MVTPWFCGLFVSCLWTENTPTLYRLVKVEFPIIFRIIMSPWFLSWYFLKLIFPIYFPYISHMFPIYVPYISHIFPIYVPYISHIFPIYVPYISHIFPIYVPYISHIFPIYFPYMSHICPINNPIYPMVSVRNLQVVRWTRSFWALRGPWIIACHGWSWRNPWFFNGGTLMLDDWLVVTGTLAGWIYGLIVMVNSGIFLGYKPTTMGIWWWSGWCWLEPWNFPGSSMVNLWLIYG